MKLRIDEEVLVRAPSLYVITASITSAVGAEDVASLKKRKEALIETWKQTPSETLDAQPYIVAYRNLFSLLTNGGAGVVPSVENLLTRTVMKGTFPTIHPAVDIANILSLEHMIPLGLFDQEMIRGDLTLCLSKPGETILPIGKTSSYELAPGTPILKDEESVISVIGSRDSTRTMITPDTTTLFVFSWGTEDVPKEAVENTVHECVRALGGNTF